jgi:hypothetical protein
VGRGIDVSDRGAVRSVSPPEASPAGDVGGDVGGVAVEAEAAGVSGSG